MPIVKSHQPAPGSTSKFRLLFIVFAASFVMNFAAYEICTTHARCWNSSPFASFWSNTVPMSRGHTSDQFVLRQNVYTSSATDVRVDINSTNESGYSGNLTTVIISNQTLRVDMKNEANFTGLNNVSKGELAIQVLHVPNCSYE